MNQRNNISVWGGILFLGMLFINGLCAQAPLEGWNAEKQIQSHLDALLKTWPVASTSGNKKETDRLAGWEASNTISLGEIYNDLGAEGEDFSDFDFSLTSHERDIRAAAPDMDLTWGQPVDRFIRLYLENPKSTQAIFALAKFYFPLFEQELEKMGLPKGLKYLPAAQSGLNPLAVAKSGAAGMWQIPYLPARRYGLRISETIDERRHYRKSTTAALQHLKFLHEQYHDWHLAIAAYHSGSAPVNQALKQTPGSADFWSVYPHLPAESRDYVPAFLAMIYVMNGAETKDWAPRNIALSGETEQIKLDRGVEMTPAAQVLGLPLAQLQALNPVYRSEVVPAGETGYPFEVPKGYGLKFEQNKDSIYYLIDSVLHQPVPEPKPVTKVKPQPKPISDVPPPPNSVIVEYTIQSGDALYTIARWFEVSVEAIQSWNGVDGTRIRAEDKLKIYVPKERKTYFEKMNTLTYEEKQELVR